MLNNIPIHLARQPLSLSLSFHITLLMPIIILIKWAYCLLIDYLKVSHLFPKLMSTNKNVLSPLQHVPIADGSGNIAPHPHYSSSTHMDSQTLPTHCSFSFSPNLDYLRYGTLLQPLHPIYLQKPLANCNHRHRTAVHLLYPIPYASIYIQYILLPPSTCFSVPTPLTPVIVTLSAQCIPTKLVLSVLCIYHRMSVYILCTSTKCKATHLQLHKRIYHFKMRQMRKGTFI